MLQFTWDQAQRGKHDRVLFIFVSHIEKLSMKPISVKKDNFSFDDLLSQSVGLRSNPIKNFEGA